MRFILPVFLLSVLFYSFAQSPGDKVIPAHVNQLVNPFKGQQAAVINGAKIYKKLCLTCHGTKGMGDGPQAAQIKTKPADFNHPVIKARSDGALFWWIETGGNDMEPFKNVLSKDQIWQTVTFIRSIQH